jgi:hypothetical protein
VGTFFGVTDPDRIPRVFSYLSSAGAEGPAGFRDFFPYFPNAADPPAVYGNGGVYPWLNSIEITNRLIHRDAGGERVWGKLTRSLLYNSSGQQHCTWEYLNGDTGATMGAVPFGGDGAAFMVSLLGFSSWGREGGSIQGFGLPRSGRQAALPGPAHHFTLRLRALRPEPGAQLLRALTGLGAFLRLQWPSEQAAALQAHIVCSVQRRAEQPEPGGRAQAAERLGFPADAANFSAAYAAGHAFMHAPLQVDQSGRAGGGMWNASSGFFQDLWWDGRLTNYSLTE